MSYIITAALSALAGFIAGALVFRNNAKTAAKVEEIFD